MTTNKIAPHIILMFILAFMVASPSLSSADAKMDDPAIVRGKIGIEIIQGRQSSAAKKRSRITTDDRLKVYTATEFKSFTYVINSNKKEASLLTPNPNGQSKTNEGIKKFPGANQFYQFDENSDVELLTIICSPQELTEIQELFKSSPIPHDKWAALESALAKKSKVLASKTIGKEVQIGGFIQQGSRSAGSFIDKVPVRRGNSFLIKKYEFRVYNAKK